MVMTIDFFGQPNTPAYTIEFEVDAASEIEIISVTDPNGRNVPLVDGGWWDTYGDAVLEECIMRSRKYPK